ncbi:MAG: hypothetical protein SFW67_25575 [Myxococcaceae bacterium]|nr:hypothetical protein [Myxococcaceae bacterium]
MSANGSVAQFPCVEALVKEAPPLREWKVVAFRQRRPMDWSLDLAGVRLTAAQLAFRETGRHDGKVDLEVLVPGYSPSDEDRVLEALFAYLDALVGERDVEQKIGAIELVPDQGRASPPSRPLTDLPQLVDSL